MKSFKCTVCGNEFGEDEAKKDADGGLHCPVCNAPELGTNEN